jgi:uncharacterized protein (DUF924 family)
MKDSLSDILHFWFTETAPSLWFQVNEVFDAQVHAKFRDVYDLARMGGCERWKGDPDGCLALCLVFDQFPRNMFRGTPRAYESDAMAVIVAKLALSKGFDQVLPAPRRRFMYLPLEHSEHMNDQRRSVELFEKMREDDPVSYEYALRHLRVIEQFSRFPHRNAVLGRESTPEELAFLKDNPGGF